MKYSYNWLKELSKTKLNPVKLGELVALRAFEFEEARDLSVGLENIVVGRIRKKEKHPNADKLSVCKVFVGNKTINVVCGARNISEGNLVPVALAGSILPNGLVISRTKIRGVESEGMLCSKKELLIGDDHKGIYLLDERRFKPGQKIAEILGLSDWSLEFSILPNRAHDALSHLGLAREIAAMENRQLSFDIRKYKSLKTFGKGFFEVKIKNKKICPRYCAAHISNVSANASPYWMQSRLRACGQKPINLLVDIANYVMLETGQPIHIFDSDKLAFGENKGSKKFLDISIRFAKNDEKIKLIDGTEIHLSSSDLLICEGAKPIALAGIMGGFESAVDEKTTNILVESACFNGSNIRKSRIYHNISTEASYRFEREIHPELAAEALLKVLELIKKTCPKAKVNQIIDQHFFERKLKTIDLSMQDIANLLGVEIKKVKVISILKNLGFSVSVNKEGLKVTVPQRRLDVNSKEDLIEEIGRIFGYEKIRDAVPLVHLTPSKVENIRHFENKLRFQLALMGASEVVNYSFYSEKTASRFKLDPRKHLKVENPMNPDQRLMRQSLIPSLSRNLSANLHNFSEFFLFEIGRVFFPKLKELPKENLYLALARAGINEDNDGSFKSLKGLIETLFNLYGLKDAQFSVPKNLSFSFFHPACSANIVVGGVAVGIIGNLIPQIHSKKAAFCEINLEKLLAVIPERIVYHPISKYPVVERDISMFIPQELTIADLVEKVQKNAGPYFKKVEVFDIYQKAGKKSVALRIIFGSYEKTLSSKEIDRAMSDVIEKLEHDLKVIIRKNG